MSYLVRDPRRGVETKQWPAHEALAQETRLNNAWGAFAGWREASWADRGQVLRHVADGLDRTRGALAETVTREMGKPITEARAEVEKCAWLCRYVADHGEAALAPRRVDTGGRRTEVRHQPLGPILAIMPWNFPLWQVFRFVAPYLMAGNVAVVKPASTTPGSAEAVAVLFAEAAEAVDAPAHLVQTLRVDHDEVPELLSDARLRGVTLTGSMEGGRAVAQAAGRALKKVVLELGGSDPFLVLEDADVDQAAQAAAEARCTNSGQSCIAAKRFLVHDVVYDRFMERFVDAMKAHVLGDPLDPKTTVGPIAREDLLQTLERQVEASIGAGARVVLGGKRLQQEGWWYPPTILVDVPVDAAAWSEELFGPVAAVRRIFDDDEALRLANGSRYGLGASVWTRDDHRASRLADGLECGVVFVNGKVRSDPRVPFGGVKDSGFGRELGDAGFLEFVNTQTVWFDG